MKVLKNMIKILVLSVISVCLFGGFTIPSDVDNSLVTIYSGDGRILQMSEEDAQQYIKDGWTTDIKEVMTDVWKTDGKSKNILKAQVNKYRQEGWSSEKSEVTEIMVDKDGNEKEVFKERVGLYEEKGWRKKKRNERKINVEPGKKAIALTFDDGPNAATTNRLLDILEKNNVKATFFLLGNRVESGKECVKRMYEEKMEIGSHTYDHKQLTKVSGEEVKKQVEKTSGEIKKITGEEPTVLRPPYGSYNENVKKFANAPIILWSVDTLDWKSKNANAVYESVMNTTRDGSVLLFHDIYETTIDAIERIVPELKEMGFDMVTVSELAEIKGKTMENGGVYTNF